MKKSDVYLRLRSLVYTIESLRDIASHNSESFLEKGDDVNALGQQARVYAYEKCIKLLNSELDSLLQIEDQKGDQ